MDMRTTWKAKDASVFAGVPYDKLQLWLKRGYAFGTDMSGGGSQGVHRVFTFQNILEFAYARAFNDQGVPPPAAFESAAIAAYQPETEVFGDAMHETRAAGHPFPFENGPTLIMRIKGKTHIRLLPTSKADHAIFLAASHTEDSFECEGFSAVNMTAVFRAVCSRMGVDPDRVTDAEWAGEMD